MKFYERGSNRAALEKEFFSQLDNPLLGKAFKLAIIGEWLAANSLDVSKVHADHCNQQLISARKLYTHEL